MKLKIIFLLFLLAAFPFSAFAEKDYRHQQYPNCELKPYRFEELGIAFTFEQCKDPMGNFTPTVKNNQVVWNRVLDPYATDISDIIILSKKKNQTVEQAITEQFISKLPQPGRSSCKVVRLDSPMFKNTDKLAYTIRPTGKYGQKIMRLIKEEPANYGCGDYGDDSDSEKYFEYHPNESKTKFLFVNYGQELPLYDANSIKLFDKIGTSDNQDVKNSK